MLLQIHAWDYVVLCAGMMLSLGVGIFYAFRDRNNTTTTRYYVGDSKMRYIVLAASMVVTMESSITLLGYPAEVYIHGFIVVWTIAGIVTACVLCLVITIPLFQPLKLISVFEYFQLRHNSLAFRQYLVVVSCINMVIYSGVITFGTSIALSAMVGIPTWACIAILVSITIAYTALGGFKAVVAVDAVQGFVVLSFAVLLLICGTIRAGGIRKVFDICQSTGRLDMFDFDPSPLKRHTVWTLVVGNGVRQLGVTMFQPYVQRICAAKSASDARKVVAFSMVAVVAFHVIFLTQGLIAYAYFSGKGCDPFASKTLRNPNQIVPFMVLDMFGHLPGVTGLFLAALCSISISTLSSLFNSISAVLVIDVIKIKFPNISSVNVIRTGKGIVILSGVVCVIISVLFSYIKGPLTQIAFSITGAIIGPLVTVFYLSIFIKFTTTKGLVASTIVGYAFGLWISLGYNFSPGRKQTPWMKLGPIDQCPFAVLNNGTTYANMTNATLVQRQPTGDIRGFDNLYSISYMYFTLMVILVALPTGLVVSWFTKPKEQKVVADHLMIKLGKHCFSTPRTNEPERQQCLEINVDQSNGNTFIEETST